VAEERVERVEPVVGGVVVASRRGRGTRDATDARAATVGITCDA
jgi:hypothetical protein